MRNYEFEATAVCPKTHDPDMKDIFCRQSDNCIPPTIKTMARNNEDALRTVTLRRIKCADDKVFLFYRADRAD